MVEREKPGRPGAGKRGTIGGCENIVFWRTKLRGPLVFHVWTVVDRDPGSRGPLFFTRGPWWTVDFEEFFGNKKSF